MSEERHPDGQIRIEKRGRVLLICVDRPEKLNGWTPKMFNELTAAYTQMDADPELFCGLVHAEGKHFTAGLDMPKVAPLRAEGRPIIPPEGSDPFGLREPLKKKPVVVALKGISFTVAIELMLAADVVIAADDCRFSQMEVKRGIMPGLGGSFRIVERAGWGNAMRYLLTGDEFNAQEALRMNLVQEVVPAGKEFDRALEIAERIAAQAPLAVQATMENARTSLGFGWIHAVSKIQSTQRFLYNTEDAKEGIQSFKEKRDAKFVGR